MRPVALELDGVLGDTWPLWRAWLDDLGRRAGVAVDGLPADRAAAAARLDVLLGNWRALLERFAEDRVPVYIRPAGDSSAALRRLGASGVRIGVFTDAPHELASVALAHLGAARRVEAVATGEAALERLLEQLGGDAVVIRTRSELTSLE